MSEEIDAGGLIGRDFRSNWVWVSSWRFYIPSNSEILWFLSLCSKNFCRRKNISSRTATLPELQPQILICLLLDILPVSINLQESRESGVRITALSFWAPDHTPAGSLTDSMSSTPMAKSSHPQFTRNSVILRDAGNFHSGLQRTCKSKKQLKATITS